LPSISRLQEMSPRNMILLVGPPGSGKSTFCRQTVLSMIEMSPVIYVTTEAAPSKVADLLREEGLGVVLPHPLAFVDALLVFDSLTSPYLLSGPEILRFMRMTLLRFAAEGNAVLACVDEGCGNLQDLVAMMSTADGIVKIELRDGLKIFNVIKHPALKPTKIEVSMTWSPTISYRIDVKMLTQHIEMSMGLASESPLRTEVGDYVNIFWPNFGRWSGMLWDPKRFPTMTYNSNKYSESMGTAEFLQFLPRRTRLFLKLFIPKKLSKVKDMKKLVSWLQPISEGDRFHILEYLEDASSTDEHFFRVHEVGTCWGFENVGAALSLGSLGGFVGGFMGFEKEKRDWNAVETKCIGLGDPYCEAKIVPGEIDGLKDSLGAIDSTVIEKIHNRLMDRLVGFVLHGKPLWKKRPRLGNEVSLHAFGHIMVLPAISSERYQMAMRLGGVIAGKEIGELLMDSKLSEDEVVKRIINFLEYCKVGKILMGDTLRMVQNCEMGDTLRMVQNCESFAMKSEKPSCFFTTGFFNGFFSSVKNQHIKETKCIAMGDPYCEWEFR